MASKLMDNIINYSVLCLIQIISHIQIHIKSFFLYSVFTKECNNVINIFQTHFAIYFNISMI